MIKKCLGVELQAIYDVINDAAQAYCDVIPEDAWHEPYMRREELRSEISAGVEFWGYYVNARLVGVMGVQDKEDVTLIRHAYVLTNQRRNGIGTRLLKYLEHETSKPILIGTWSDASWAIEFYKKNGYKLVSSEERGMLLNKYWSVSQDQANASVVLADTRWVRGD